MRVLPVVPLLLAATGVALAQPANQSASAEKPAQRQWAPPGTPGSPIKGEIFHAQILLSAAGFSPGVIDGKGGQSTTKAIDGFQESRGLDVSGRLDTPTRQALLQAARPSTRVLALGPEVFKGPFIHPFPKDPKVQAKLPFMGYRNPLEKLAEMFHTTPATIVALNPPGKKMRQGETLRLPNVLPTSRDFGGGLKPQHAEWFNKLNVDANQPQGDKVVVDKSESVLRVLDKDDRVVAQFHVTMGSKQYPLPIGTWKVTSYAFLPPFLYQPDLLENAKTDEDVRLPPGPNGPVGVAWLDLTKEHYGIHGTSEPQTLGRAASSGCIRMANWDVLRLSRMLKPGFTAVFQA